MWLCKEVDVDLEHLREDMWPDHGSLIVVVLVSYVIYLSWKEYATTTSWLRGEQSSKFVADNNKRCDRHHERLPQHSNTEKREKTKACKKGRNSMKAAHSRFSSPKPLITRARRHRSPLFRIKYNPS